MDTNEIDFVNRPADFDDLVTQIQKAKQGRPVLRARLGTAEESAPRSRPAYNFRLALFGGDPGVRDVDRRERSERWPPSRRPLPSAFPRSPPPRVGEKIAMLTVYDAPVRAAARRGRRRRPARRRLRRDDRLRRALDALGHDGLDDPPLARGLARRQARARRGRHAVSLVSGGPRPRPCATPAASCRRAAAAPSRSKEVAASCRPSRRSSPRTSRSWGTSA